MKKGISPEAAGRLAAFMKGRAAQYNPEDWSPADAVADILSGPAGVALLRAFSTPLASLENDVIGILDSAYDLSNQEIEASLQEGIDGAGAAVSAEGFSIPNSAVWEGLKQGYADMYSTVLGELRQKIYDAFDNAAANLAYAYQEAALQEFKKAAGGQGGEGGGVA